MSFVSVLSVVGAYDEQTDDLQTVVDSSVASPGLTSFIAIALLALVSLGLIISMVRRLRRVRYREEVREQIAVEIAERDAQAGQDPDPGQDPGAER